MFDFGIATYRPRWLEGQAAVAAAHGRRLASLVGRRLTRTWAVWDPDDDTWFADGPVLFDFDGEQVEINHQKLSDLSITWNSISPADPIRWPELCLCWRDDAPEALAALRGRTLRSVDLLEWASEDLAYGMVAVCFRFDEGPLTIYNALDENGLSRDEPDPAYQRPSLARPARHDDAGRPAHRTHEVPAVVRNKALAAGAARWLADLPELVAHLEREWSITVGRAYEEATEAFVTDATLADGTPAVLKLLIPRDGDDTGNEATVLRLANGEGCVRLLRADAARDALLLERLGRSLSRLGLPIRRRHEILGDTAAKIWRPAPGCGLPTGAEKARWLAGFIERTWEELSRPCTERAIAHALRYAERRADAHDDERAVLVHGDVHEWNVLEAGAGFKLVDPDGLLAEPEYDLGVLMREDPLELLDGDPRERARRLARRHDLDAEAIWEWGVVERVSTGLLATKVGLQPEGRRMLTVANRLAASPK